MERNINLEEISDGKLYNVNDMVKADCNDCTGCSACCRNMGTSIVLDPLDVYQLTTSLQVSFESLLTEYIELNVVDGMILPNLQMNKKTGACSFLNEEGRCKIHAMRPGICRIFPLGRIYENHSFQYFLQVNECKKKNRTKIKVKKWIDVEDVAKNESYMIEWHYFLKDLGKRMVQFSEDTLKNVNLYMLNLFFVKPYEPDDFYEQFALRMKEAKVFSDSL